MKKIRSILFLVIVSFTFQSCQTVKEGFTSQKKKSTDEINFIEIDGIKVDYTRALTKVESVDLDELDFNK